MPVFLSIFYYCNLSFLIKMHNTFVQVVYRNFFYFLYSYTTQTKLLFRFSRKKADDNSPALLFVFYIFTIANIFAITGNFVSTFELRIIKVIIESVLRQKLFMRTLFDNITLVHNEYDVGIFDGRKSVRDYKRSLSVHKLFKRPLYLEFGSGIYRRSRLVEYKHRRVREHNSGYTE